MRLKPNHVNKRGPMLTIYAQADTFVGFMLRSSLTVCQFFTSLLCISMYVSYPDIPLLRQYRKIVMSFFLFKTSQCPIITYASVGILVCVVCPMSSVSNIWLVKGHMLYLTYGCYLVTQIHKYDPLTQTLLYDTMTGRGKLLVTKSFNSTTTYVPFF